MDPQTLLEVLRRAGATFRDRGEVVIQSDLKLTKAHLFEAGLTGGVESRVKRKALLKSLDLPENLTTNGLLDMLNMLYSYEAGLNLLACASAPPQ